MNAEVPKPAPKGALRRLRQRLFPEAPLAAAQKWPPISDEKREEILKRLRQEGHPALDLGFNPLDIVTIFIKNMINFNYYDKNDKADEASVPTEKVTTQTAAALGNLKDTMKEIKNNLHFR